MYAWAADLAATANPALLPPHKIRGMIIGYPGGGKSSFLQSIPNSFYMNLNRTSTTTPTQRCLMWPTYTPEGALVDSTGRSLVLSWDIVQKQINLLIDLAQKNLPRPATIVIDHIGDLARLLNTWLVENASVVGLASADKKIVSFNQLDGRAAYGWINRKIISVLDSLHAAGYGVWTITHLVNSKVRLNEDLHTVIPELTLSDGLYKSIFDTVDFLAVYMLETVINSNTQMVEQDIGGGRKMNRPQTTRTTTKQARIALASPGLEGITKSRVPLPALLDLPHEDAWAAFEKEYLLAMNKVVQTSTGVPNP